MKNILPFLFRPRQSAPPGPRAPVSTGSLPAPKGIRFLPGEEVLLLVLPLPRMPAAQRRAAAAFAAEVQIARPLDEVHVALGPEMTPGHWLVGIVARAALPDPRPGERLLPDTLALPVPLAGHWSVWEDAGRILIRCADGTGLATQAHTLPLLHQIAGQPDVTLYGGEIGLGHARATLPPVTLPARFDLTDPRSRGQGLPPFARNLAGIAAVAVLGHLAILLADTASLRHQHRLLATELRAATGSPANAPVKGLITRILAPATTIPTAGFLPVLGQTFAAMTPQAGRVALDELRYAASGNSLALTVQATDLGTLQEVETSLLAAGLQVSAGPAVNANGTAEQQLTIQGPPG